ncbi:uncharacterized protein LOC105382893 [Plutella xylostella]|uniref:uncharacterized protein LOC105382893 n=1 Tax=Plutella xylostella TaxID=51655 RepID=UPI00203290B3|nr:uncharacterized protein LOC105382893 [Plutella xylostella]
MASTMSQNAKKSRYNKLTLKKNRPKDIQDISKASSPEVITLDDTFDRLRASLNIQKSPPKIYSPIILDDSTDVSFEKELPKISLSTSGTKTPSKMGNVSFNHSQINISTEITESRPSLAACWSPAQSIICATPRQQTVPSTPRDRANESSEQCSIKKIHQSQKKLLDELYGEVWKSIPNLFKTAKRNDNNSGCTKKLDFDDDDSDKENNIRKHIKVNKELYLTGSDAKRKVRVDDTEIERKSKKKLYTELVPSTPEPTKTKHKVKRHANTTSKKVLKGKSVTEIVDIIKDKFDVNDLTKKVEKVQLKNPVFATPVQESVKRLSFIGSLGENVPNWRCHPEAFQYRDNYKTLREKLTRRLFEDFNKNVFADGLEADMPVVWDSKLRSTAGTTTNRLIKTSTGVRTRTSSIKLSLKVLDAPCRLRDTLIHEMCHAATWVIDQELRAGHGPLWRKWATRALAVYPELGEISRCHDLEIHFKYSYKCGKCGYTIHRHSKSIDVTKKCCGYCRGTFELVLNKKNKDGVVISTPARQGEANQFAKYVKENYGTLKSGRTHAQVMKMLGEQFSAKKNKAVDS